VWAVSPEEPSCLVLLAAYGEGATVLDRQQMVRNAAGAAGHALHIPDLSVSEVGGDGWISRRVGGWVAWWQVVSAVEFRAGTSGLLILGFQPHSSTPQAWKEVPPHLQCIAPLMASLVTVPIGNPDAPLGTLMLAHRTPRAFEGVRWQMRVQVAAMGVLRLMRQSQVEQMCAVLKALDEAEDPVAAISTLLRVRFTGWW